MTHWEMVKALFEALDARGKKTAAHEMMAAIRNDILPHHFPMPLHQAVDRFDNEYGDLVTKATLSLGVARFREGGAGTGGGTSDRTSRQADYLAKVSRVNADLQALFDRFSPLLEAQAPRRRPSGTWRDEEASQVMADQYALATNEQLRAEYPAGAVEAVA